MTITRLKALLQVACSDLIDRQDDDFVLYHLKFLSTFLLSTDRNNTESVELALKSLINLCSSTHRSRILFNAFDSKHTLLEFVSCIKNMLFASSQTSDVIRQLASDAACNLTRDEQWSECFFASDHAVWVNSVFCPETGQLSLLPLLLNMTSNATFRRRFFSDNHLFERLVDLFLNERDTYRATLLAGALKNFCFEDDFHRRLLDYNSLFLESLLCHLCGPEDDIDTDDRRLLPKRIQMLAGNPVAVRSGSVELKLTVCQALLQLCATCEGRTRLRARGTYFVLRELHKFETSRLSLHSLASSETLSTKELLFYIEQIVDQLICEENEREKFMIETSLRQVHLDPKVSSILERTKADYISDLT